MKVCVKCNIEKGFEFFGHLKSSSDGYRRDCKECRKKYSYENKEKIKEYKSKYYELNKELVLAKNKEEAKEKFQEGDVIGEIDEYPTREEINVEVEEAE
jgi:sortase (surface protein transpeptidase)